MASCSVARLEATSAKVMWGLCEIIFLRGSPLRRTDSKDVKRVKALSEDTKESLRDDYYNKMTVTRR